MAKLNEIVEIINLLVNAKLTGAKYASVKQHGLASLVTNDKNLTAPFAISRSGEGSYVGYDDKFPFTSYHRYLGSTYNESDANYGNDNSRKSQVQNMVMMVMGKQSKITLFPDDLEMLIVSAFPSGLTPTQKEDFKFKSCGIKITGSNHDLSSLFKREFANQKFSPDSNKFMFELRYQIECTWGKECINTLCCSN
jgi:hypothetical protein